MLEGIHGQATDDGEIASAACSLGFRSSAITGVAVTEQILNVDGGIVFC